MAAYRLLHERVDYPLHLGVTEAGTPSMGVLKSAIGIGGLLCEGIGDTMRVSLTADPVEEVYAAKRILRACGLRRSGVNLISCPTCGRTRIDLIGLANQVEQALAACEKPITVAVMGCVVNGPGEGREADIGICGGGNGAGGAAQSKVGEDIQKEMTLSFMDAAKGCKKTVAYMRNAPCESCKGTGAKDGTAFKTCSRCGGKGVVQSVQNTVFGRTIRQGVCPDCGGTGKIITEKCADCKGKGYIRKEAEITFNVPAGVNNGSYIRKRGGGHAVQGGVPGDLIIVFKVEPHKLFVRDNFDLKIDVPVSFKTAALGGVVKVPGVDDTFDFTVPEGTQSGQIFTVRGRGIKSATGATGNLIIRVIVEVPSHLTREQKRVLEETDAAIDLKQYDKRKKYADVVESLYGTKPY